MTLHLGLELKCQHCTYKWTYTGKSLYMTNCPRCGYKVSVAKALAKIRKDE